MNVLSLFDGIACGRMALERARIQVDKYYASEVDKYTIQIAQKNYPKIIQVGNVTQLNGKNLPKIDLIIGGSPCQGFSYSGKRLNFEDPRSRLFFEFVRLVEECRPKYFLLENVKMKKENRDIISYYLGIEPMEINSALVSAQNRKRLYWFNWKAPLPKNRQIYLKHILEEGFVDRDKSFCIDASYVKGGDLNQYFNKKRRQLVFDKPIRIAQHGKGGQGERVYASEGKSVSLSANGGGRGAKTGLYAIKNKSKTTRSGERKNKDRHEQDSVDNFHIRKLTPVECERLQTLPDNYTKGVSKTQRYKMLGNGWTVSVVAHLFNYMNSCT